MPWPAGVDSSDKAALTSMYDAYLSDLGRIGERHQSLRQFYITICSIVPTFITLTNATAALQGARLGVIISGCLVGVAISVLWWLQMRTFSQVYRNKIETIRELEASFPLQPFTREAQKEAGKQRPSTTLIDSVIPVVTGALFLSIIAYYKFIG